ncbi:MAG: hypothetical protein JSS98_10165 [Bacteroidetes bacterium]|nr:hypothetical protein [Bacteroidota bacterium]
MKKSFLSSLLFLFVFINCASAQSTKAKPITTIRPQVQQLIHAYFQHFDGVKGDTLSQSNGSTIYSSKILPSGAIESSITQYKPGNTCSWQATLLRSEDFDKAVEVYKKYYQQLSGMPVVLDDKSISKLAGQYDKPEEARSFASSILELQSVNRELRLLKVEIAINYNLPEWSVKLLIYEKQADEDMRPTIPGDKPE